MYGPGVSRTVADPLPCSAQRAGARHGFPLVGANDRPHGHARCALAGDHDDGPRHARRRRVGEMHDELVAPGGGTGLDLDRVRAERRETILVLAAGGFGISGRRHATEYRPRSPPGPSRRVLGQTSASCSSAPSATLSRQMIRVVAWVLAVTLAVACSYTQMQPKQGDRPP